VTPTQRPSVARHPYVKATLLERVSDAGPLPDGTLDYLGRRDVRIKGGADCESSLRGRSRSTRARAMCARRGGRTQFRRRDTILTAYLVDNLPPRRRSTPRISAPICPRTLPDSMIPGGVRFAGELPGLRRARSIERDCQHLTRRVSPWNAFRSDAIAGSTLEATPRPPRRQPKALRGIWRDVPHRKPSHPDDLPGSWWPPPEGGARRARIHRDARPRCCCRRLVPLTDHRGDRGPQQVETR